MIKSIIKRPFFLIISLIIFSYCILYLAVNFQWQAIFHLLENIKDLWLILLSVSTILLFFLIRTFRWYVILKNLGVELKFSELYLCSSVALSVAIFTPVQSGEILKIELLKRHGIIKRNVGYSTFLLEKIVDLFILIFVALCAIPVLFKSAVDEVVFYSLLASFIALLLIMLLILRFVTFNVKYITFLNEIKNTLNNGSHFLTVILISCLGWTCIVLGWQVMLLALSIDLGFGNTAMLISSITLISIMSFIPGAIGVSEVGITEFLLKLNYPEALAQSAAIFIRIYGLLTLFCGVCHLFFWHILMPESFSNYQAGLNDSQDQS